MRTLPIDAEITRTFPAHRDLGRYARTAGRILLGLVFFVCGLDFFLEFLPRPSGPMSEAALAFAGGLARSGYLFPWLKATEVLAGALLLGNRFVPLALTVLAPIVLNIVAFHAFLAPSGLPIACAILVVEIALAWSYRAAFRPMLAAHICDRAR